MKADTLLGFASGPNVSFWFFDSVINLFKSDPDERFTADWVVSLGPYIHSNRNDIEAEFMASGRDWLFMVDTDMVFKPSDVFALLDEADARGPGIYSAPYLMEHGVFVCGPWSDEAPANYHPIAMVPDEVVRIGMVGAGFTLVHRSVYDAVGPGAYSSIEQTHGEDVSFAWRAKEAGFVPWLVPVFPGHAKTIVFYPDESATNLFGAGVSIKRLDLVTASKTDPIWRAATRPRKED